MGKVKEAERFIDNKDNTVTDSKTGLQWIKDHVALGGKFTDRMDYKEAEAECGKLNVGGVKDWRLPTREELLSIVDLTRFNPAVDPIFINTKSSAYWTSTTYADYTGYAWFVSFYIGYVYYDDKVYGCYVRPVRSSQ